MVGSDHFLGLLISAPDRSRLTFHSILSGMPFDARLGGVIARTVIREIRFVRLGNGTNIELFDYESADGQAPQPRNNDIGGYHLALYVDDLDAAIAYLRSHNVEIMGEPTASAGASEGQRWIYFRSPWGLQFELVSFPNGKAYEASTDVKLWHPGHPAE